MKRIITVFISLAASFQLMSQCAPSFTWAQTAPNEITFTNTTTPIVQDSTTFTWFFGDNTNSSVQDPVHIYSGPDTVQVCMIVFDSILDCSATFCDTVVVTGTVLCNNLEVYASTLQQAACSICATGAMYASVVGGTAPYTFSWSNGATTQAAGQFLPGIYSCTVTDVYGCTAIDSGVVMTGSQYPCGVSWNNVHMSGDSVLFRGDGDWWTSYEEYSWDFGDNTTGSGDTLVHEYMYADTFTVCIYMVDSIYSCYTSFCDTVIIDSIPPPVYCYANIYGYQSLWNEYTIWQMSSGTFSAQYYWSWGDNTFDTAQYPVHVYNVPGTYTVCVTVVDTAAPIPCSDSMCLVVVVPNASVPFTVNSSPIPIGVDPVVTQEVSVYPNPAAEVVYVDGMKHAQYTYVIADAAGRNVQSGRLTANSIPVSELESGIYLITFSDAGGQFFTKRFVKE